MKRQVTAIWCAGALIASGVSFAAERATEEAAAASGPTQAISEFEAAWNARDARKIAEVFTPDGTLRTAEGDAAEGRAEIRQLVQETQRNAPTDTTVQFSASNVELIDRGTAVIDVDIRGDVEAPEAGREAVFIAKRDGDRWRLSAVREFEREPLGIGGSGPVEMCPEEEPLEGVEPGPFW